MVDIPGFLNRFGTVTGRPTGQPAPPAAPIPGTAGAAPVEPLVPPIFEAMPERRPNLAGIERPTVDAVLARALTPDFLGNARITQGEFMAALRAGAARLAGLGDDDAGLAAAAIEEALQDKEMLESCRLLLVKG